LELSHRAETAVVLTVSSKGAALLALSKGMTAYIIPNGYAGLYNLVDIKSLTKLTPERIEAMTCFWPVVRLVTPE
jgi:hypothetical protein